MSLPGATRWWLLSRASVGHRRGRIAHIDAAAERHDCFSFQEMCMYRGLACPAVAVALSSCAAADAGLIGGGHSMRAAGRLVRFKACGPDAAFSPPPTRGDRQHGIVPDDERDRIYESWIEGLTTGESGSTVAACSPVRRACDRHGGKQSMLHTATTARHLLQPGREGARLGPDWTVNGLDGLSLWFRGNAVRFLEGPRPTRSR